MTAETVAVESSLLSAADRRDFERLERSLGGASALAVSALGADAPIAQVGTLRGEVAWSTIKVPLAVAAIARLGGQPDPSTEALLRRAITVSDNEAAEALWGSLGPPAAAAAAVQEVLAAGGDSATKVESRVLRPGFTAFGQTEWEIRDQQRFVARLPCVRDAGVVLELMRQVTPGQRWGLGSLGRPSQIKGGWGPNQSGGYLVRQIGIVSLPEDRWIAASMATEPADGTFESGAVNLTRIAQWLMAHVDEQEVARPGCQP